MDGISACRKIRTDSINNLILVSQNMLPSIPSLTKICNAFGITLSQFFVENDEDNVVLIKERQRRLLYYAAKLEEKQYTALINFLETL